MATCRDIMTASPSTASPQSTLQEVASLMEREDTGIIPIVEGDRLVGAVTDRDIAVRAVAKGRGPDTTASDVMTTDLATIGPNDTVQGAVDKMGRHQIRRIFVCENDRLLGVISQADVARRGADAETGNLVEEISQKTGAN
jgi:CBS domain-containing protein